MDGAPAPLRTVLPGEALGPEETLWEGSPSWRVLLSRLLALGFVALVLPVILRAGVGRLGPLLPSNEAAEQTARVGGWIVGALIAYELLRFLGALLMLRNTHYKLTNQRLIIETGTLSKTVGEIDLRSVGDTQVSQSLLDRLLGIGSVALISTDKTSPVSVLRWMAAPRSLRELIRTRAYQVSHRHLFTRAT
ncbi:PH domain-containing protein [Myxococcus sp. AB056]|uniref:PH domain-containing protein n=1 Tax=Myxococcus sp. AB056 TaxID=2562792 RepID=UPI001891CC33|nr:PH domain-containing protein [Myxococcus sp. AB056]